MNPRPALLILALALAVGCGARSSIPEPEPESDGGPSTAAGGSPDGGAERSCPPNCTVGHECCAATCFGPAVPMPSDCCTCLPGEISSFECGNLCAGLP